MKIQNSLAIALGALVSLSVTGCQGRAGKKVSTEQSSACPGGTARVDGKCAPAAQQQPPAQFPPPPTPVPPEEEVESGGIDGEQPTDGATTDTPGGLGGSGGQGDDGLYVPPDTTDDSDIPYTPGTSNKPGGGSWNNSNGGTNGSAGSGSGWNSGSSGSSGSIGGFGAGSGNSNSGGWNSGNNGLSNNGLSNNGLSNNGTNNDLRDGAPAKFLNSAPTNRSLGAPHVKLVAVIRDRKLQVLTSFSHVESVTDVTYSYGKEKFDPNGRTDASTGVYTAQNVRIPVTIKFTFDGRPCTVTATAPFTEDTLTPTCG